MRASRRTPVRKTADRLVFYGALFLTLAIVGGILYFYYSYTIQSNVPRPYQSVFELSIVIGNPDNDTLTNSVVPANIGVANGYWNWHLLDRYGVSGRAPMYTLDTTGLIRIQSTAGKNYTLGDFFLIWGVTFNDTCIQPQVGGHTYCNDLKNTFMAVTLVDNGQRINGSFQTLVPLANDVIRVAWEHAIA